MLKVPANILITDDEKDFVKMLSMRLKEMGEKVHTAFSGRQCLDLMSKQEIDIVVLDIKMPEMDGMETLKEIKRHHPVTEVIMLTGHGSIETAVEGMKMGAFDYILKPADFDDLSEKLEAAKRRNEEQKERIRAAEAKLLLRKSGVI